MSNDLSNETVFILAVLAILISILGATTVFFETSNFRAQEDVPQVSYTSGSISLDIKDYSKKDSSSQGQISLDIAE
ncbi:hypothetical protein KO361_02565 [Candidatus Woesearchaeota archaeon]|nr:hypothetical protein [Candidatus Woesearchaeota archaeon]